MVDESVRPPALMLLGHLPTPVHLIMQRTRASRKIIMKSNSTGSLVRGNTIREVDPG